MLGIDRLDHLVLTVSDLERTLAFYREALGFEPVEYAPGFWALRFGGQKINLHLAGSERSPHARRPLPGSADLCFVARAPLEDVVRHLSERGVAVEEGPVRRLGARGSMTSVYFRDPDANLLEVSVYGAPEGK